jgi:LysR family transcriptional regulator, hydrogen peroxide-inducible genes activator
MSSKATIKQLRYLLALADKRNFRIAAESVGVTQPSLSAQISELETLLNLKLLERGKGPFALTPAGRQIVERARTIIDEFNGLEDLADTLRSGEGGMLRLGSSLTIGPYLLPTVLQSMHRAHPNLSVHMWEGTPSDLEDELLIGNHDAIITQMPVRSSQLKAVSLFREPLYLVVPTGHHLTAQTTVTAADLAEQNILTLGQKYALTAQIRALCIDTGAHILDNYVGTSLDGLRLMVGMEMGLAIMPALYVRSEVIDRDTAVVAIAFQNQTVHRTMGLAWRQSSGRMGAVNLLQQSISASVASDFAEDLIEL